MFKSNRNYYGGHPVVMCTNITKLTKYKMDSNRMHKAFLTFIPDEFFNNGVPEKIFYSEDYPNYIYPIQKEDITDEMLICEISIPKDYFDHFDETPDENGVPPRSVWVYYLDGVLELMPFEDIKAISGIPYNKRCIG